MNGRPRTASRGSRLKTTWGGAAVVVLQSQIELKRGPDGKWSFAYKKPRAPVELLKPLVEKAGGVAAVVVCRPFQGGGGWARDPRLKPRLTPWVTFVWAPLGLSAGLGPRARSLTVAPPLLVAPFLYTKVYKERDTIKAFRDRSSPKPCSEANNHE